MKIIAESAYNHMGKAEELEALLAASKASGADYFTAQIMDPLSFSTIDYSKHQLYIDHNITFHEWEQIFIKAKESDIEFIPCPLDEKSLNFVLDHGSKLIKIHATDLTNRSLLEMIAARPTVKVILETQAATNFEIRFALSILGHNIEAILTGYSNYPTEFEDLNLDSIDFLKSEYGFPVGLADHSPTVTEIPLMALAKGCKYLEKHITISRNNRHFDWQVSLYPEEFRILTEKVKLYSKALGNGVKHPVKNELPHRTVLFKKVQPDASLKRSDGSYDYITNTIRTFQRNTATIGIIARLKSQRLPKKVLAQLGQEKLIEALYNNVKQSKETQNIYIATSTLPEDNELVEFANNQDLPVFRGHAISVVDRLLDLAWNTKSGVILRVTGDNPFTSPILIDEMIKLVRDQGMDYARAVSVPFGMSAEAFSTDYLWDLYLRIENPMDSEYLTWFVLLDDKCKKGCVELEYWDRDISFKNLSVDYPEDLQDCRRLLECTNSSHISNMNLKVVLDCASEKLRTKEDGLMKLPGGKTIRTSEYINMWMNIDYLAKKRITAG